MSLGRRLVVGLTAVLVSVGLAVVPSAHAAAPAMTADEERVIGASVDGRPIVARHYGDPAGSVRLVVIGQMHGNEPGGRAVVDDLLTREVPPGVSLWIVRSMNPDGHRAGTRTNARGTDLNRNFPTSWRRAGRGTIQWSGPRAASEPETRALMRFLTAVQPTAVLSYHQAFDVVDISHRRSVAAGRELARLMGETAQPVGCPGGCRGTMTQWIDDRLGAIAITVELDDRVSPREARRAAGAVLRLAAWLGG